MTATAASTSRDALDDKVNQVFAGKCVRKDLVRAVKVGANVPVFVLEYLLGRSKQPAWPGALPERITNRILMLPIELPVDLMNHGKERLVVLAAYDSKSDERVATPIQAIGAELDRDTNRLKLTPGNHATIGLMLPAEVSTKKLYLELRDAATDLVLHKSPDLPVDLIS